MSSYIIPAPSVSSAAVAQLQVIQTTFNINIGAAFQIYSGPSIVPVFIILRNPVSAVASFTFTYGNNSPTYNNLSSSYGPIVWTTSTSAIVPITSTGVPAGITAIWFNPSAGIGTPVNVTCEIVGYYL